MSNINQTLESISKEQERVKFAITQCTQELKETRHELRNLEDAQGNETLSTTVEESTGRSMKIVELRRKTDELEAESNIHYDRFNELQREIIAIIEQVKQEQRSMQQDVDVQQKELQKVREQFIKELEELFLKREALLKNSQRIEAIAKRYLEPSNAKDILKRENDLYYFHKETNMIRDLLVKSVGRNAAGYSGIQ